MEVISNSAIESSLSFNIKFMQQKEKEKKLPRTISKWWYKKKVTLFFKNFVIFYKFIDPFAMGVRGHKC